MSGRYHHGRVKERWQEAWQEAGVYEIDTDVDDPEYILGMFPYTSGSIHMGHVRNYTITDAFARFRRMQGADVLHPMGWDAFGLPAENAAHERGIDPATWTHECIAQMREQLRSLGLGYAWSREITTCEPSYYQWNQWLFARLFETGLVDYREATVNWCPDCETVLADAQVIEEGREKTNHSSTQPGNRITEGVCWRCDTSVVPRSLPQWFFTITDYADELVDGLDELDGWPSSVKEIQRNWIRRTRGASITFELVTGETVSVFTRRADTVFGATYLAVSPTHELATDGPPADADRWWGTQTDHVAITPIAGNELPVYVASYVLEDVGTGATMGVPGHDERDYAFASEHNIPIEQVIETDITAETLPITEDGIVTGESQYAGETSETVRNRLFDHPAIDPETTYRLRDWLISRQRYWGTPIPVVHCPDCGPVLVPDDELPITLPPFEPSRGNPLASSDEFVETTCPECGSAAKRETDTMDTFVDSSWYFLRFLSPEYAEGPFDPAAATAGLPVDLYVGGDEHAVLHLLYLRFIAHALAELGMIDQAEPIERLLNQGTVVHSGEKMSKSVGNVVSPHEYGPETTRAFVLGAAHPERDFEWTATDITQAYELQQDLYALVQDFGPNTGRRDESFPRDRYLERELDRTIVTITQEYSSFRFHRAIAEIEALLQLVRRYQAYDTPNRYAYHRALRTLSLLVAPVTPYLAEELWRYLGERGLIAQAEWPQPLSHVENAERERSLVARLRRDVREIVEVAGIENPDKITLTIAAPWKFDIYELGRDAIDADHFRTAVEEAELSGNTAHHMSFVGELTPQIKQLEPVLSPEREHRLLEQAAWLIDDEFSVAIDVIQEKEAQTNTDAMPGRPAIKIR